VSTYRMEKKLQDSFYLYLRNFFNDGYLVEQVRMDSLMFIVRIKKTPELLEKVTEKIGDLSIEQEKIKNI
jgi:hypothetical protein